MRYLVSCNIDNLSFVSKLKISNLRLKGDKVYFKTNDLNILKDLEYDYKDLLNLSFKSFFKYNIFILFGFIFLFIVFFIMSKTITKIDFVDKDKYDYKVYSEVESALHKRFGLYFMTDKIGSINQKLRSTFYDYQWVSVKKEGTVLYIDIVNNKDIVKDEVNENVGSLYSKYDTVIEGYYIEEGSSNIKLNRSVKKGDVVISGYIKTYGGKYEEVNAKGYAIGTVLEEVKVNIDRLENKTYFTGEKEVKYLFVFNNKNLNSYISKFNSYETEYKTIINLGIFKVLKVTFYEINEESYENSEEDASEKAFDEIDLKFLEEKKYNFEEIITKEIISISKNEYDYEICIKIKKKVDILEFGSLENIAEIK